MLYFSYIALFFCRKFVSQTFYIYSEWNYTSIVARSWDLIIFILSFYNNNNNNTGYLLHAISPKSKEHIACYKHYNKLQIHCCKTLLRNIVTVTEHWQNISPTHPAVQQLIKDWGKQITLTMDTFKQLVGKTEKVCFSSGSESRVIIRRADLLRKRVPSRRGGIWERPLTIGYCTDRWTTEDRVVRTWAKLTGSGVNVKKVREVGRRVSRHAVVANTCKFVLDTRING